VIKYLTSKGIPTNATLCFVMPQFNTHPSTLNTATQFSNATNEMENFVAEALKS